MQLENRTNLPISLGDLLDREYWTVEAGKDLKIPVKPVSLEGWKVLIRWKNGKQPFSGFCNPSKKLILIAINPKNTYPFTQKFAVGTEQADPSAFYYTHQTITFNNAKELIRFIFLHEFSHLLDHFQGFSLRMKQTKANRFALANWKR